jgi:hypothetical protein
LNILYHLSSTLVTGFNFKNFFLINNQIPVSFVQPEQQNDKIDTASDIRTNPYNIVQQGKIIQISNMDDHELYKLLE